MLTYKQEKTLTMLDFIASILSLLGIIVTTAIVIIVDSNIKNIFFGQLIVLIVVFVNSTKKVGKFIKETRSIKNEYSLVSNQKKSFG